MFNIYEETKHEAGIVTSGNLVFVANWARFSDDQVPMLAPFGAVIAWPVEDGKNLIHVAHVDDIRAKLPGTVWCEDGVVKTDMEIGHDEYGDIPALFGIRGGDADPENYTGYGDNPFSGDVWQVGDLTILTCDLWN